MTSEFYTGREVPSPLYEGLLGGVANHEAKALTLAYMAASPDVKDAFTIADLDAGMLAIQGAQPGWAMSNGGPTTYCSESLEPIGSVAKTTVLNETGSPLLAYSVTEAGKIEGLAMAGLILDWSLKHPEVSVQAIFGATQSQTNQRSPIYRLAILESVLTASGAGASLQDIEADHPDLPGLRTVGETLKSTAFTKIVDIATNKVNYNPVLTIIDPEYGGRRPFEMLKPERQALYKTMQDLAYRQNRTVVGLGEFVDETIRLHPDLDSREIRAIVMQAISPNRTTLPGLQVQEGSRGALGNNKSSRISLKENLEPAVTDLINALNDFKDGKNHENWRQRAIAIVSDPEACAQLMAKARENSTKAQLASSGASIGSIILQHLSSSDKGHTTAELQAKVNDELGAHFTVNAIRNHLKSFEKDDQIVYADVNEVTHGRAKKTRLYRLVTKAVELV